MLHPGHGVAQALEVLPAHRIEAVQEVVQILHRGVQHVGEVLQEVVVVEQPVQPLQQLGEVRGARSREVLGPVHGALLHLLAQTLPELPVAFPGLAHPLGQLVHVPGVPAGQALHEVAHLLVVRFQLIGQPVQLVGEGFALLGRELEGVGRVPVQELLLLLLRLPQEVPHPLHRTTPVLGLEAPPHEALERTAHPLFLEERVRQLPQQVVCGREPDHLGPVPLRISVDPHGESTISHAFPAPQYRSNGIPGDPVAGRGLERRGPVGYRTGIYVRIREGT